MKDLDGAGLTGLGLALAAGLLIGLERGWHQRERADGHRVAGLRTFALIGLLGGLSAVLAQRFGAAVMVTLLALVGVMLLAGYLIMARLHSVMGLTTFVAGLATFVIGALAADGAWLVSAVLAVVVLALLQFKQPLHSGIGKLSEGELNSGTQLLLISVVVLPVLPDQGYGPYGALNPYRLWWAVVLLAVLSFAGFVLMRWLGPQRGLTMTALLGGLVSSTATTATLARWARETPAWRPLAAGGATLACAAMFARMAVLVAVAAPALGTGPILTFAAMAATGAAAGALLTARSVRDGLPELSVGNPLQL
ncbi:MAG: MgtC/SapB family protein, partial [Pseudomonadota bacterium]